jgi:SsrA-binding protein
MSIKNRKARHDYEFLEEETAGIVLVGSEVKSIKAGKASIGEAYCYIDKGECFIKGMHIAEFKQAGRNNHDPYRLRKLLLTKKQILKWERGLKTKGRTIVPLKLFTDENGKIKLNVALAKGKKNYDKREDLKKKDMKRDVEREIKG